MEKIMEEDFDRRFGKGNWKITKETPIIDGKQEIAITVTPPNDKAERLAVNGVSPEPETQNPEQAAKPQPGSQFALAPLLGRVWRWIGNFCASTNP